MSRLPTLTVIFHPELSRIGERVRLAGLVPGGDRVPFSRLELDFAPPFRPEDGLPLGTPFISRSPVWLSADASGIELDGRETSTQVTGDGAPIEGTAHFSHKQVEHGVVLELSGQVVLLLHLQAEQRQPSDRMGIVGDSDSAAELRRAISTMAHTGKPSLVRGEPGVGKKLTASMIHYRGPRAQAPYKSVNLAAIPAALHADELFGEDSNHLGFVGRANTGTLFLDGLEEAPLEVQHELVSVASKQRVTAKNGDVRDVDVQLIMSSDSDLEALQDERKLSKELMELLEAGTIVIPPLRSRRDDIGRLLLHFLRNEFDTQGRLDELYSLDDNGMSWLGASIVAWLARYPWPGNVRQLRNVARHIASRDQAEEPLSLTDPYMRRLLPTGIAAGGHVEEPPDSATGDLALTSLNGDDASTAKSKSNVSEEIEAAKAARSASRVRSKTDAEYADELRERLRGKTGDHPRPSAPPRPGRDD